MVDRSIFSRIEKEFCIDFFGRWWQHFQISKWTGIFKTTQFAITHTFGGAFNSKKIILIRIGFSIYIVFKKLINVYLDGLTLRRYNSYSFIDSLTALTYSVWFAGLYANFLFSDSSGVKIFSFLDSCVSVNIKKK